MAAKKARRDYRDAAGKKLPGVTTIIGDNLGWSKGALIGWAHKAGREGRSLRERDDAASLGTAVHAIAAELLGGEAIDPDDHDPAVLEQARPNGERVAAHVRERYEIVGVEVPIVCATHGGTIDYVLRDREGRMLIGDLKTGKGIYPEVAIQLAAYDGLRCGAVDCAPVDAAVVIHAYAGESIREVAIARAQLDAGARAFAALLTLHAARGEIGDMTD